MREHPADRSALASRMRVLLTRIERAPGPDEGPAELDTDLDAVELLTLIDDEFGIR